MPSFVPSTFPLNHQDEANWCWAAVAQAVRAFFYPAALLTQCSIAGNVLTAEYPASVPFNCCQNPDQCDLPAPLQDALTVTNNLRSILQGQVLTFEQIKAELTGAVPKPVCVRIEWPNGGAHFIAIYGYREFTSGVRQVLVADPLFQDGTAAYVLYEDLLDFYDQYGSWSDTFLVKA
ncbi:MAG TPA: papain-like cysteine protease family protein [Bryobacteraceae bacterium]|nr:papain-like cysteine protease family protein [Bryobacteraceae bacterium]